MFNTKKTKLFDSTAKKTSANTAGANSAFVNAGLNTEKFSKAKTQAQTSSANGALKYSTTGNPFVDQFGKLGEYKTPRPFTLITKDSETLWNSDKLMTVAFTLYMRMITRVTSLSDGSKTSVSQKGAELRHEGIMRMLWLHFEAPRTFWNNVGLFISVGSWNDIITMLKYDLVHHGWEDRKLDWDKFGKLILSGLHNENTNNLVKKYLPQIKAKSACKTVESQADNLISKWICSLLFGSKSNEASTYKQYRKLKTSGTAHEWQKLISQGKHKLIDFDTIHGRALNKLVRSKYLDNQGLKDKYEAWVTKDTTDVKYTGFVHELFENLPSTLKGLDKGKQTTINKQFDTLVTKGGEKNGTKLIVVRDTSGSMSDPAAGTNMSCFNLAKALAIYFSEFLTGSFQNAFIEFNSTAKMHTWKGDNALEKWYNDNCSYIGGTNFQTVVKLFCTLKEQGIKESDFPTGILCVSDSEFNPSQLGKTNVETALSTLRNAGFSKEYVDNFVIVLWNVRNTSGNGNKFETYGDVKNVFYFSGFSPATVSFLTSEIKTASELFAAAMDQEILNMVQM